VDIGEWLIVLDLVSIQTRRRPRLTYIVLETEEMKLVMITGRFALMDIDADTISKTSLLPFLFARAMLLKIGTGERAKEAFVVKPLTAPIF
jgi:hypothetical protein